MNNSHRRRNRIRASSFDSSSSNSNSMRSRRYGGEAGDSDLRITQLENKLEELIRQNAVLTQQQKVQMTVTSESIPKFSSDNETLSSSQWIEKIEQLKQINNWNDLTTIYQMQLRLTGSAKSWYNSLSNYNYTWKQWKALIQETFPEDINFAAILRKMLNRQKQPTESITTYYFEKMQLLHACGITGKKSVSCIIDGILDPVVQNSARAGCYDSPEALYERYLSALGVENSRTLLNEETASSRVPRRDLIRKIPRMGRKIKCFNCQEKGHAFIDCKKPKMFCLNCNRVGHITDNCNSLVVRASRNKQSYNNMGSQSVYRSTSSREHEWLDWSD